MGRTSDGYDFFFEILSDFFLKSSLELESSLSSFRDTLRSTWTRRAVRLLTATGNIEARTRLLNLSISDVENLRDKEWEKSQSGYHTAAVEDINSLVRRYNGVAPYPVRRVYISWETELLRVYSESAHDIVKGIKERLKGSKFPDGLTVHEIDHQGPKYTSEAEEKCSSLWESIRSWLSVLRG